jgi:hypothetical protein
MKGPKIISLDYEHDFVLKKFVKLYTSTPNFKSFFTQILSHIVHQTKLLNILLKNSKFEQIFNSWFPKKKM